MATFPLPQPMLAKAGFNLGFLARSPSEIADRAKAFTPDQPDAFGGLLAGALLAHPDCMQTGSLELCAVASAWTSAYPQLSEPARLLAGTWIRAALDSGCGSDAQRLHRHKAFAQRTTESPSFFNREDGLLYSRAELKLPLISPADGAFDLCAHSIEAFQLDMATPSSGKDSLRPPTL